MTPEHWQKVKEIFQAAVDCEPSERSAFLAKACVGDESLRKEVESLIARMDVVLTTRLHGMVLAIKNGVPAVVIDPVAGGAKIRRQAETLGWPVVFSTEQVSDEALDRAFADCLQAPARAMARACAGRAAEVLDGCRREFLASLQGRAQRKG